MAALLDGVAAVAVLGDDPRATGAVALGLARAQALHRRVFLADMMGDPEALSPDDTVGVSDMIRYGISLGRAAQPSSESPNLFTMDGGAESPLAPDVLGSPRWRSLSAQVHAAGALLLVAVPSHVPQLNELLSQLDGVILVGEAAPTAGARVLGEVHTAAMMRTPSVPAGAVPAAAAPRPASWRVLRWIVVALAAVAGLLAIPQVREPLVRALGLQAAATDELSVPPPTEELLPPIPARVTSDAAWSAEVRFLNSRVDAQATVAALLDSFPAATFAELRTAADSTPWYRVLLGAFSDSVSAENFLASLRTRGTVPPGGGAVSHVPFALLVDSASDDAMARLRVAGYQGRGLPAYLLRDSLNVWHIYVGAFADSADAGRLKVELDSLNIQSALVVRAGSAP